MLKRLWDGLLKTRQHLGDRLHRLFSGGGRPPAELLESVEELLIEADVGVQATQRIMAGLRQQIGSPGPLDEARLKAHLKESFLKLLVQSRTPERSPGGAKPALEAILMVGVNGVGKTTTIGKLAARFGREGHRILLAAGDTFRAAAIEQLKRWGEYAGCEVIAQQPGADPAAVAYDALLAARSRNADIVLVDSAGRLHTKSGLMEELRKIKRVMDKAVPGSPTDVFLVLDATTGQNAVAQARMFHEVVGVTGVIMTKLDGTARGGMLVAIADEFKIPIRYIGVGEKPEDLLPFDPTAYVEGLLA